MFSCERQAYKPEAVVRAYRAFVESFGGNFAPPPVRGAARRIHLTPEDLAQQKRTQHLSDVRYHCRFVYSRQKALRLPGLHRSYFESFGLAENCSYWFVSEVVVPMWPVVAA